MVRRNKSCDKKKKKKKIGVRQTLHQHVRHPNLVHSAVYLDHWEFELGFLPGHTTVLCPFASAATATPTVSSFDTAEVVVHHCSVVPSRAEGGRGMEAQPLSHHHHHRCRWVGYSSIFDKGNCKGMELVVALGKAHTLVA